MPRARTSPGVKVSIGGPGAGGTAVGELRVQRVKEPFVAASLDAQPGIRLLEPALVEQPIPRPPGRRRRGQGRRRRSDSEWLPWTALFLEEYPQFVVDAFDSTAAKSLLGPLGVESVDSLRSVLRESAANFEGVFLQVDVPAIDPLLGFDFDRIGTR